MAADENVGRDHGHNVGHSHQGTETKPAVKTSELIAYVVVFIGILIASVVINGGDNSSDPDLFTASQAWLYITILTLGYMISRGLAKSGSREPSTHDH